MPLEFAVDILDAVAHPIFVKDREYRFVLINRAFCEMIGRPRETVLGRTDYDFFSHSEADFFREKDRQMFATNAKVIIDEEPLTDAGGVRHVLATTKVPLSDADGTVTHLVGIIHDITRLKVAEEHLRQANELLEQRVAERAAALRAAEADLVRAERLAVLGRLAGGLAHEIRNPLGAIKNAAYLLKNALSENLDPRVVQALAIVHEEVRNADQIITDLIDYARVRPAVARPIPIGYVIEQVIAAHPIPANVELILVLPEVPFVAVDADQVRGAFSNLVRNAIDAMPQGGRLTIRATEVATSVVVSVIDTGIGVPEDIRNRLFEPLITSKARGLGLGLTTARALVENQGGTIAYVSTPECGTRFDVTFQIATTRDDASLDARD